ncbi:MAG: amidohydrolase family protein [Burkholderiaceae bacterium]
MKKNVELIIDGGSIVTLDGARRIIRNGSIAVDAGRIAGLGKRDEVRQAFSAARTIDAADDLVLPGFIDAHHHPVHYMTKGSTDDLPFVPRIKHIVQPYERVLTEEEAYLNATATFAEMLLSGTTCFNDAGSIQGEGVARAARDAGIRGVLALESVDVEDGAPIPGPGGDWAAVAARAEAFVDRWNGAADGRLRAGFTLTDSRRVSDGLCLAVRSLADRYDTSIHGHMVLPKAPGATAPLHRYRDLGLLCPRLSLTHLGYLPEDEIALLVSNEVKGVHCPGTSTLGGLGVIGHGSIPEMLDAGMTIGLGSDAATVSRTLDMIRHMHMTAAAHKDARRADVVISCFKALEMATIDGAHALRWADEIGSIEPGKRADIIVVDARNIELHPNPHANPVANLVYSGSGRLVETVIVNGTVVVENRRLKTIDVGALLAELGDAAPRVLERIGARVKSQWPIA